MSRAWTYVEPGLDGEPVFHTLTEGDILMDYYPWWADQMRRVGKADLINAEHCIEDWVTVHWAAPADA